MTLNQVIQRIKETSLNQRQVRNFYHGLPTDFLTKHTAEFPSIFLQDNTGNIDLSGKTVAFGFRMYALDLVNVSDETKLNELDVQSDMHSIITDLLALLNFSIYQDWKISASNSTTLLVEEFDDMVAGVVVDFSVTVVNDADVCGIPTADPNIPRYIRVLMRNLDGELITAYPVFVYDTDGNQIGFAQSQAEYVVVWNNDAVNRASGYLTKGRNEFAFVMTLLPGASVVPYVIGEAVSEMALADIDGLPLSDLDNSLLTDI